MLLSRAAHWPFWLQGLSTAVVGALVCGADPCLSWLLCSAMTAADVLLCHEVLWCGWLLDPVSIVLSALVYGGWPPRLGHCFGGALGPPGASFQVLEGGLLASRGSEPTRVYLLGTGGRVAPLDGAPEEHTGCCGWGVTFEGLRGCSEASIVLEGRAPLGVFWVGHEGWAEWVVRGTLGHGEPLTG